ncbi:hypothetical protein A2U01_0074762, partial [Trifolium medium]|nr:hypothetical protein [Trifolium medium]
MIGDWRLANTMKPKHIAAGSDRNISGQHGSGQSGSAIRWKKPKAG